MGKVSFGLPQTPGEPRFNPMFRHADFQTDCCMWVLIAGGGPLHYCHPARLSLPCQWFR
jgi:hypothetical protein